MYKWDEIGKNWFVSIVIDTKFNSFDKHQKLMAMSQCQSIYEFEGGTELIWHQQAAGAHEALISVKAMLDYAIRRITSDKVNITSLRVISEEARIAEIEVKTGPPDKLP